MVDRNEVVARRLAENLADVRERIAAAARRAGRDPNSICLTAVTKYVDASIARMLVAAGCHDLGESRPQQLWAKAAALSDLPIRWHLIGHLQRNKARRTITLLHLLQSGDSPELLRALNEMARQAARPLAVLLEVNISGDPNKHGMTPDILRSNLAELLRLEFVQIRGLMAMASIDHRGDAAREDFTRLRQLRDELQAQFPSAQLDELSMGMSGDFEQAIEQGATIVRVGSALFEGIDD